jgi:hypothetical protein
MDAGHASLGSPGTGRGSIGGLLVHPAAEQNAAIANNRRTGRAGRRNMEATF